MKETAAAQRGEERKSEINNFNFLCYIGHRICRENGRFRFRLSEGWENTGQCRHILFHTKHSLHHDTPLIYESKKNITPVSRVPCRLPQSVTSSQFHTKIRESVS